jgi:hypothetical protein
MATRTNFDATPTVGGTQPKTWFEAFIAKGCRSQMKKDRRLHLSIT